MATQDPNLYTKGNMLESKKNLEFEDFWISHDEGEEDQEDSTTTMDVLNCLGISNLVRVDL